MHEVEIQNNTKIRVFGTLESSSHIEGEFRILLWNIHKCLSRKLPEDIRQLLTKVDMVLFQEALLSEKWEKLLESFGSFEWGFFRGFHFPGTNTSA
jgi:endonuclease/exonuclease/phosphatase family metal-dependent hydrolase